MNLSINLRVVMRSIIVLILSALASVAAAQNLIIFGDSLSDMGNNTWARGAGYNGAPITNQPTAAPKILWPNLMAGVMHSSAATVSDPKLYTQDVNPLTDDVNYAYASAETGYNYLDDLSASAYPPYVSCTAPGVVAGHACVPGVLTQIHYYLQAVANAPSKNTRFVIWAGGNDFFNNVSKIIAHYSADSHKLSEKFSQLAALFSGQDVPDLSGLQLSHPISNLKAAINLLIKNGVPAENIYVFNLPDMSKTPAAIAMANGNKLILDAVSMLSAVYDFSLRARLTGPMLLRAKHVFKVNKLFKLIETNQGVQQAYDLTDLTDSCVAKHANPECVGYVFYNDKHPTLTVEHLLSNYFQLWTQ